jgi:MurNAc alpha-1-phosphate uridylyltransferase
MSRPKPDTVMLLAAGLGTRMRPVTVTTPKPLVKVGGRALIDWCLDVALAGGVERAIVNLHHLGDQLVAHFRGRTVPSIVFSDESARLLDTGGGVVKALPLLGGRPFFVMGTDAVIVDRGAPSALRLLEAWDDARDDCLMLMHPRDTAQGFDGAGDFFLDPDGRPRRRGPAPRAPFVYAGLYLMHPRALAGLAPDSFSMNTVWDRLIAAGRLRGIVHDGAWFHVGTPEAIAPTTAALAARGLAR